MYSDIYQKFAECAARKCGLSENDSQTVVAAVSGGADSVCMLLLLLEYCGSNRLICAHFNHKIRGAEAERDLRFTQTLAEALRVPFLSGEGNVPAYAEEHAIGIEEAARILRYDFLRTAAARTNGALIATAHNREDRIETVLHNIARGASIDGLRGIEYQKDIIIRPILDLSRKETEAVCAYHGITPVFDSTNADNTYTRNKIRNEILPYLKNVFGESFEERLLCLSKIAALDSDYLNTLAETAFSDCCSEVSAPYKRILLDREQYKNLHGALQRRLVRLILSRISDRDGKLLYPGFSGIYSAMIERVCKAAEQSRPGRILELPQGILCVTEYGTLAFTHRTCLEHDMRQTEFCGRFTWEERCVPAGEALRFAVDGDGEQAIFDADALRRAFGSDFQIQFRTCRQGDHFIPFGAPGGKSLRKFLIDRKVGKTEREFLPVAAIGSEILWIPGMRRSALAPIDKNTTRVIILKHIAQTEVNG